MNVQGLKLVIWDLDDTFWTGTLSEGEIVPNAEHIRLVKELSYRGIVNSICSKNDMEPAIAKLEELGVSDYFVFPSINWDPKGQRISTLVKDMKLRAENVLFIDDNIINIHEAQHYNPNILASDPDVINSLIQYIDTTPRSDKELKRLNEYKILEQKHRSKENYNDNEAFLYSTNTKVQICNDCVQQFDRIYELVHRTNQLNFTKIRCTREELHQLLEDTSVEKGYVKVQDKFGDYGIVGFYAIRNKSLIHFLFSCRTIGQGVEQYVYAQLGYPSINVVQPVVAELKVDEFPMWINQCRMEESVNDTTADALSNDVKILFKGPCDMLGITSYLNTDTAKCELTYIGKKRHNNIEHWNHSINYLSFPNISEEQKRFLVETCVFNDEDMFATSLYDSNNDIIFLSTLHERHFGIYRHTSGIRIAFGEWCHPLTDPNEWKAYVEKKNYCALNDFTYDWLREFSASWVYEGRLSNEDVIANIQELLCRIGSKTQLCLFLGSEYPYPKPTSKAWQDRHIEHKGLNDKIREFAQGNPRVHLIEFTDYIKDESDYTDSIDHFQRRVYHNIAQTVNAFIAERTGHQFNEYSKCIILKNRIISLCGKICRRLGDLFR